MNDEARDYEMSLPHYKIPAWAERELDRLCCESDDDPCPVCNGDECNDCDWTGTRVGMENKQRQRDGFTLDELDEMDRRGIPSYRAIPRIPDCPRVGCYLRYDHSGRCGTGG